MITLYDYYRSSASYRVRLVLAYKNINYKKHEVHLVKNGGEQNTKAYQEINPQQLVPTIYNKDDNITFSQSLAIIEYLEELHPEPSILSKDLELRAMARSLAYTIACDIHPLNNLRVLKYLQGEIKITDTEKTKWYHYWMKLGFDSYEDNLNKYQQNSKYSLGGSFSLADVCLLPQVYNALRFELPMDSYPKIMEIYQYCLKKDYVLDAAPKS